MTPQGTRRLLAACSMLLSYPDQATYDRLPLLRDSLPGHAVEPLGRAAGWLAEVGVLAAQEHYVEIFDRRRKACLYLTYFLNGDTRRRGMALVRFQEAYRDAGFALDTGELPDFLPVVLEFGAVGDLDEALALLSRHRAGLVLLEHALRGFGSPYADVVEALLPVVPEPADGPDAETLAASGPPTEMVGLTPFVPIDALRVEARA